MLKVKNIFQFVSVMKRCCYVILNVTHQYVGKTFYCPPGTAFVICHEKKKDIKIHVPLFEY